MFTTYRQYQVSYSCLRLLIRRHFHRGKFRTVFVLLFTLYTVLSSSKRHAFLPAHHFRPLTCTLPRPVAQLPRVRTSAIFLFTDSRKLKTNWGLHRLPNSLNLMPHFNSKILFSLYGLMYDERTVEGIVVMSPFWGSEPSFREGQRNVMKTDHQDRHHPYYDLRCMKPGSLLTLGHNARYRSQTV